MEKHYIYKPSSYLGHLPLGKMVAINSDSRKYQTKPLDGTEFLPCFHHLSLTDVLISFGYPKKEQKCFKILY